MKNVLTTLAAALLAALNALSITVEWEVDAERARSETISAYHGETLTLAPDFGDTNITASVIYYQTNGMGSAWWSTDSLVFHPTNDIGAASYRFFVAAEDAAGRVYRANGTLRLLDSPGFVPNALPLPVEVLDFSAVEVANAPYFTKAETAGYVAAATNAIPPFVANEIAAATNALAASIVIPETPPQRWSRPDAWSFHAVCDYDSETPGETTALSTNAYGMVFAERYNTVVRSNRFRFAADWLDPYRSTDALELSYTVPAATNLLDVFFFPSNGVYRVHALNAEADTAHSRDIVISGIGSTSRIFAKEYTADANTARNSWQTHSLQYIATTTNYAPKCTHPGRGNTDPIFLAPGVVMSAAHWGLGNLRTGDYTITNNNHNVTITIGAWERLDTWAARNGFTQEEIAACYKINDVAVAPVVSVAKIPTALCPLLRAQRAAAIKEHSITGLLAYRSPQEGGRPQPVIMYAPGRWTSGSAITAENAASLYCRTDIRDSLLSADWLFPSHGGDSGKPVLYIHAGVEHLLSFCSSGSQNPFSGSLVPMASGGTGLAFCSGPDLLAARAIIAAYCTAHGTSLREEPEEE